MTIQKAMKLLKYVMENNSWKEYAAMHGRHMPKYVDIRMDTRDGEVFSVSFSGADEKTFRVESDKDLDKVYVWLNEYIKERDLDAK